MLLGCSLWRQQLPKAKVSSLAVGICLYQSECRCMLCTQVALVLIDEVHLLNESRGAALEAGVISRIKMIGALPSMSEVVPCSP